MDSGKITLQDSKAYTGNYVYRGAESSAGVWVDAGHVDMIEVELLGGSEGREPLVLATRDTCDKILDKVPPARAM